MARGVISAQGSARTAFGPGDAWFVQVAVKVDVIEPVKALFQIDVTSARSVSAMTAAACKPCSAGSFLDFAAEDKSPIGAVNRTVEFPAVQFREQNQRQSMDHRLWRIDKQIADSHAKMVLSKSCRVIQAGKRKVFDSDRRRRSTRFQFGVGGPEYCFEMGSRRLQGLPLFSVFGTTLSASCAASSDS